MIFKKYFDHIILFTGVLGSRGLLVGVGLVWRGRAGRSVGVAAGVWARCLLLSRVLRVLPVLLLFQRLPSFSGPTQHTARTLSVRRTLDRRGQREAFP